MLCEKWTSIIFHSQDVHEWNSNTLFQNCEHGPLFLYERVHKVCLKPDAESFIKLQEIVFNPRLLNDLECLVEFSHTGIMEVYHSLYTSIMER